MTKEYLKDNISSDNIIECFDELPLWSAPFGLKLLDKIDYKPHIAVLDIGFGAGFPLTEIAMRLGNSCVVYGIDPWKEAVKKAFRKTELYQISNIKIIDGVAEQIPLESQSIDLIVSNNGINNVSDINKTFDECSRVIKSGGQFVQTMNLGKTMFEFYDLLKETMSELDIPERIEAIDRHIQQKRPDVNIFTEKLQRRGFLIQDLNFDQFNYYFTDGTTMFNHHFIRLAFMDSWKNLLPEDRMEEIFDIVEAKLNKQAELLGKITLSIPFVLINALKK